jgi:hypothetical protein
MSAQKKKTVQVVEVDEIDEEVALPTPKVKSRSKLRAAVSAAHASDLQAAIVETRREMFQVYELQRGTARNGLLPPQLANDPAFLFLDASMTHYFIAYRDADTDEERLEILQSGLRFFRKMARQGGPAIERRRKLDQEHGLAICFALADPGVDTRHWKGRPRVSELFPLEAELDHREELKESRAKAAKAAPKMPVFVDKSTIPIMSGVIIEGVGISKNSPVNVNARTPKRGSHVRKISDGGPRAQVTIMPNTQIDFIDQGQQRTLRDAGGLIQNPRVKTGALGW